MTLYNPFAHYPISGEWQSGHEAIDYATPYGTPFTAPADGVYRHMGGSTDYNPTPGNAGLYGRVYLDDGTDITVCHLSAHNAYDGQRVEAGKTDIATTGNSGYVIPAPSPGAPYNGSHMHTYGRHANGARWNWTLDASTEPEDDMNTEQDARLKNIENLLAVSGQGYGWPQVAGQAAQDAVNRIGDVQTRIGVPDAGYDWLPAINNKLDSLWWPIGAALVASVLSLVGVLALVFTGL